jgi:hypothetical protein
MAGPAWRHPVHQLIKGLPKFGGKAEVDAPMIVAVRHALQDTAFCQFRRAAVRGRRLASCQAGLESGGAFLLCQIKLEQKCPVGSPEKRRPSLSENISSS